MASQFKRQFSVLDIGANYGWFGQRLVRDFDCVYFAIDNKVIDPHPRIWHIKRHLSAQKLLDLSRCESFDMVLCLSVLHHFEDYTMAFQAAKRLGWLSVYEIPGKDDSGALAPERHEGIQSLFTEGAELGWFDSHVSNTKRPAYCFKMQPFITEQTLDAALRGACGYCSYKLYCDHEHSVIEIDRKPIVKENEVREFIPGMNAYNFQLLGGEVEIPKDDGLPDYQPWNFIIGDGIHRIDTFHVKP